MPGSLGNSSTSLRTSRVRVPRSSYGWRHISPSQPVCKDSEVRTCAKETKLRSVYARVCTCVYVCVQ